MDYSTLFSLDNIALLSDWLEETGELYVDIYLPHSGGGSSAYFLHSLSDLKALISQQTHPEIAISVFHYLQYPLRGVANEILLRQALENIPDGEYYAIVSLDYAYPSSVSWWGSGNSHDELRREFADVLGKKIGIGQNPFDIHSEDWFSLHPDQALKVSVLRNQNHYERYAIEPEKYKRVFELWQE
jgi:hypothetical protein